MTRLRAVGYWSKPSPLVTRPDLGPDDPYVRYLEARHDEEARSGQPFLADPRRIIDVLGCCYYPEQVVRYLEAGHTASSYLGYSICRCCGATGAALGSRDLTDGIWVWPEGLTHYLRAHGLSLPPGLLDTMARHDYTVPAFAHGGGDAVPQAYDYSDWCSWAASVYARRRRPG